MVTQKSKLIIESFNQMGYHAAGIGDDDLALGKEFVLEISKKANFPLLSSNLMDGGSGKLLFQPYVIREINGLRIGIFSLLGPEAFLGESDIRRKGLTIRTPVEVAQTMVKELQPRSDLIILLSHLGYQKDMKLAQTVQGIHFIVGGHTGMNLSYPPLIRNTLILQTSPKGMYAGRLNLLLHNQEPVFYNSATRQSLERNLASLKSQLSSPATPEAGKAQLRKAQELAERNLRQFQGKNEFTNVILPLTDQTKEDPDIQKMIEAYHLKFPDPAKQVPHK